MKKQKASGKYLAFTHPGPYILNMNLILTDRPLPENLRNGPYRYADVSAEKIAPCMGCFACWTKTPGKCVIRDAAVNIYPAIAAAENVMYISRVVYGSYDIPMKTMLERAIPVQKAFIRIHGNETHHVQREVLPKKAVIIAYGTKDEAEREVFRRLVTRNALNMIFSSGDIIFCSEEDAASVAEQEIQKRWNS